MRKNHLAALAILSLLPLGAAGVVGWAYLTSEDQLRYPAYLAGAVATSRPSAVYHLIVEPHEARGPLPGYRTLEAGRGPSRLMTQTYDRFVVVGLDPLTGKEIAEPVKLCDVFGHSPMEHGPAKLLGVTESHLWMWNGQGLEEGGLEAYDRKTLKLAIPHEKIRAANPEVAKVFPKNSKEYKYLPELGGIAFYAIDARHYVLNLSTLKIDPVSDDALAGLTRSGRASDGWSRAYPLTYATEPRATNPYTSRIDLEGKIYLLQAAGGKPDFSPSEYPKEVMVLASAGWTRDQWGSPIPDASSITPLGASRYFKPGFLRVVTGSPYEKSPLVVDGTDALLLHRASTDRASAYRLTRIHLPTGKEVWSTTLGLTELWSLAYTGDALVFVGDLGDPQLPQRPLAQVALPLDTGKPVTTPFLTPSP